MTLWQRFQAWRYGRRLTRAYAARASWLAAYACAEHATPDVYLLSVLCANTEKQDKYRYLLGQIGRYEYLLTAVAEMPVARTVRRHDGGATP